MTNTRGFSLSFNEAHSSDHVAFIMYILHQKINCVPSKNKIVFGCSLCRRRHDFVVFVLLINPKIVLI